MTTPPSPIAALRREYSRARLDERDVLPDPIAEFRLWLDNAIAAEAAEPTAMTLATATPDGVPSARVVLLKALDERGFTFFSDYRSRKAQELADNPRAALVFWWTELERQVRVTGVVGRIEREESEAYYRSRPLGSRIGAWASVQSQVIPGREWLETELAEATRRFADGDPPLPPHWGGFRLVPERIEFWQGRESRLHDRIRYTRSADGWMIERLAP